jgi:16S rRNA C1402 N4-methylase RsmH
MTVFPLWEYFSEAYTWRGQCSPCPCLAGRGSWDWLQPRSTGLYVDGTLGLGGHTQALLEGRLHMAEVIGFEWDEEAAGRKRRARLSRYAERFRIVPASYASLLPELDKLGVGRIDGLLADLGVSSLQLDQIGKRIQLQGGQHS